MKASSCPRFGGSRHVAEAILAANELDPTIRATMNIKHTAETLEACRGVGLKVSSYDRREEPEEVKMTEGGTIPWGTRVAIRRLGSTPDIIYHDGDWGKEPMIEILGVDARRPEARANSNANRATRVDATSVMIFRLSTTPGTTSCSSPE